MRHIWWISLWACAPRSPAVVEPAAVEQVARPVLNQSPLDDRAYRYVQLDNGLKALLISDPDTEMAAAALDVHVGHYADPEDRQGLAHFLEHMLFMGTDRFPGVDDYRKFVEDHGGSTNAGTGGEHTSYHFQIEQDALLPAFERFSRFFVAPLLDPEYVDRERNAVDSEYSLKTQDDWRRSRQVRKSTTNLEHPEHKFSVGNLDTLADHDGSPVYEDLMALYEAEYRPDRMAMAIYGRESLDTLEGWVREQLSEVRGEPVPRAERPPPFTTEQLGVRIDIVPLEERRELELQFPMPPQQPMWPHRPYSYLSHLLGHEGEGTLFDVLKSEGWIEALSARTSGPGDDYDLLRLEYRLTEAGVEHIDDIIAASFAAFDAIHQSGLPPYPHDESRTMADLGFRFAEPNRPVSAVRGAASTLHYYDPEHVLDYWATYEPFDPELVRAALEQLTVDNLRVLVTLPDLQTDQVEPLYEVPWAMRPLTDDERSQFTEGTELAFQLPPPNPYLPETTEMLADADSPGLPSRLSDADDAVELWALPDTSWGVPRGVVRVQLYSPAPRSDAVRSQVMGELAERVLDDSLQAFRYPMDKAGLDFDLSFDDEGASLWISGYDNGQLALLDDLVDRVAAFEVDPERLEIARAAQIRRWRNQAQERPLSQAFWLQNEALDPMDFDRPAAIPVAEAVTAEELQAHIDGFFDGATARVFVHGNHDLAAAEAVATTLSEGWLAGEPQARPTIQRRVLPAGVEVVQDAAIDHDDSVLVVRYQGRGTDAAAHAPWLLLGALLDTPFFTQLRTEQQLGYSVGIRYRPIDKLPGLRAHLQSGVAGPLTLLDRVDSFLLDNHATLSAMPLEEFETIRSGVVTRLTEPETQLMQRNGTLARNLSLQVETFDWRQQLADAVGALTHEEMATFYEEVLLSDEVGRLITRSFGRAHAEEAESAEKGCPDVACAAEALPEVWERTP